MYADDTKIWREIKYCEDDHYILQRDIDSLVDWALQNCMKCHLPKCKVYILFSSLLLSVYGILYLLFNI